MHEDIFVVTYCEGSDKTGALLSFSFDDKTGVISGPVDMRDTCFDGYGDTKGVSFNSDGTQVFVCFTSDKKATPWDKGAFAMLKAKNVLSKEGVKAFLNLKASKIKHPDRYMGEPYVYAEYVIGPDNHVNFGEGPFTWNTGTAPWMFMGWTQWILGIKPDFKGIKIDPCLPSKWKWAEAKRPFRGKLLDIKIKNVRGKASAAQKVDLKVDGKKIEGNLIPSKLISSAKSKVIKVEATVR